MSNRRCAPIADLLRGFARPVPGTASAPLAPLLRDDLPLVLVHDTSCIPMDDWQDGLVDGRGLEIAVLGRFSVRRDGQEIPPSAFGGSLARAFVRMLVVRRGAFVSRDVLADSLWRAQLPADPAANLRVIVSRARRALGDPTLIVTSPGGYSFSSDERCVVDAEVFLSRVRCARTHLAAGQVPDAVVELEAALGAWGGEPLSEDAYEDWAQEYRRALHGAYQQALEDAAEAALIVGDLANAVAWADQAASREPLRDAAHVLLARALVAAGDPVRALRCLEDLRSRLRDDLGLEPSPEWSALQLRILRGDAPGRARPQVTVVATQPPVDELRFVGRETELGVILGLVGGPAGATVAVSAPPGMGKSRLLAEVMGRSSAGFVAARAAPPERDFAWALARSLVREALNLDVEPALALPDRLAHALADLVPEVDELRPIHSGAVDPETRRALAFEAGVRVLGPAATRGAVIVVDDLHWVDATSITFLALLRGRLPELRLVLAYRGEEASSSASVGAFLRELPVLDPAVVNLSLGPLAPEHIAALVGDEDVARAIADETDRSPFAVAEVIRALSAQRAIETTPRLDESEGSKAVELARQMARAGQRKAVAVRVRREPGERRELLALLALGARETPARVLAAATGRGQGQVLDDLERLARAGLVRLGDGGWAPDHDLISDTVGDSLTRPERGRLHQLLADAMHQEGGDRADVARHLAAAGDREAAAAAFAMAARERLAGFAGHEAVALAEAGLTLRPSTPTSAALLETRGEARVLVGDLGPALEDLRCVLATSDPGPLRARLLARLALFSPAVEGYAKASAIAEASLTEAAHDPSTRAEALAVAAILDVNMNRMARAEARAAESRRLFEELGDARGVATALDAQAMAVLYQGRIGEATELLDRVARLYRDCGQLHKVDSPRSIRGSMLALSGRPHEALRDADEAIEVARFLGQREGEIGCSYERSRVLAALGRLDEAHQSAEHALAMSEMLAHREGMAESWLALSIVHEMAGDIEQADRAAGKGLELAEGMPLIVSRAAGRAASVAAAKGDLITAEAYAARCLAEDVPLWSYEARLVQAEVSLARGKPDAEAQAARALSAADAGGYRVSPARSRVERILEQGGNRAAASVNQGQ